MSAKEGQMQQSIAARRQSTKHKWVPNLLAHLGKRREKKGKKGRMTAHQADSLTLKEEEQVEQLFSN